jgi:hypothetical protein
MTRANILQGYNHYLGAPDKLSWDLDRYRHTTLDGIRAAAERVLDLDDAIVIVTNPGGGK